MSARNRQVSVTLSVNDEAVQLLVDPTQSLLDILRFDLELRGAHRGCDTGHCGSCTVLLKKPGVHEREIPVVSCLMLAAEADGCEVTTVEGLVEGQRLHPVQQSFVRYGGLQCGYCTAGMIMAAVALYRENPRPTEAAAKRAISGNLCRCTGYAKIVQAIVQADNFRGQAAADIPANPERRRRAKFPESTGKDE